MTEDQSIALVAGLVAAFPDAVVGVETLSLYARFLRDVDEDTAALAVGTWIARERKFPLIADLRAAVDGIRGTAPPDVDEAYAEVIKAVKSGRQPVRWSHPAVKAAVDAVGFREIGQSITPGVERAHFNKAYESAKKRTADASSTQLVQGLLPEMKKLMQLPAQLDEERARRLPAAAPKKLLAPPARKK